MSGGHPNNGAGGMTSLRSQLGPFQDLDLFAVDSNAAKLPVGRGHSRPRAADNMEDDK